LLSLHSIKLKRRSLLKLAAASIAAASLGALAKALPRRRVVRPPGALVEEEFLARCLRCSQCIQSCTTGALTACTLADGLLLWGTPKVDPLKAPCEAFAGRCEEKRPCAESCPTGAIVYTPVVKIGSVKWIKENCLAYQGKQCLVCLEVCPSRGAIKARRGVPRFNSSRCVGCGRCVNACPAQPKALYLTPEGEIRVAKP